MTGPAISATIGIDASGVPRGMQQAAQAVRTGAGQMQNAAGQASGGLAVLGNAADGVGFKTRNLRRAFGGLAGTFAAGGTAADALTGSLGILAKGLTGSLGVGIGATVIAVLGKKLYDAGEATAQLRKELEDLSHSGLRAGAATSEDLVDKLGAVAAKMRQLEKDGQGAMGFLKRLGLPAPFNKLTPNLGDAGEHKRNADLAESQTERGFLLQQVEKQFAIESNIADLRSRGENEAADIAEARLKIAHQEFDFKAKAKELGISHEEYERIADIQKKQGEREIEVIRKKHEDASARAGREGLANADISGAEADGRSDEAARMRVQLKYQNELEAAKKAESLEAQAAAGYERDIALKAIDDRRSKERQAADERISLMQADLQGNRALGDQLRLQYQYQDKITDARKNGDNVLAASLQKEQAMTLEQARRNKAVERRLMTPTQRAAADREEARRKRAQEAENRKGGDGLSADETARRARIEGEKRRRIGRSSIDAAILGAGGAAAGVGGAASGLVDIAGNIGGAAARASGAGGGSGAVVSALGSIEGKLDTLASTVQAALGSTGV